MTNETEPQRLARNVRNVHTTGHDHSNPLTRLAAVEAAALASAITCPQCAVETHPIPMGGTGYGVEEFHEPGCPNHEDHQ